MTNELIIAFAYVKSIFPTLTMVVFNNQGQWFYCDRNYNGFVFDDSVDVGILEDASNSIQSTPFIYELPYSEDEF